MILTNRKEPIVLQLWDIQATMVPCYPQEELSAARQAGERLGPGVYHIVHLQQANWAAGVGEGTAVPSALTQLHNLQTSRTAFQAEYAKYI